MRLAYKKFLVDNPSCSRRFHLSYDDESEPVTETSAKCPFCDEVIFKAKNHPEVTVARQENLIKKAELADLLMENCSFKDNFSISPKK